LIVRRALLTAVLASAALLGCRSEGDPLVAEQPACLDDPSAASIITTLDFTRQAEDGSVPGFDLDGVESVGHDAASCFKADFVDSEGRKGIDNQLAPLIPDIEAVFGDAITGLVQGAINNGELIVLLEVTGVDDFENDDCVGLVVGIGKGRVALGTDGVIEGYQTFERDPDNVRTAAVEGRIVDGVLTAGPFEMAIPLALFDVSFTLHFHDAMFRFTIDGDRRYDGVFGGAFEIEELIDGVKEGAGVADNIPLIRLVLGGAADFSPDEAGKCRRLSSALRFAAVPAFIRE
jgi:hypothetical protein